MTRSKTFAILCCILLAMSGRLAAEETSRGPGILHREHEGAQRARTVGVHDEGLDIGKRQCVH